MLSPIDQSPDESQKPTMEVNEHVVSLAVKRLNQGITPKESRRRLIEQGYTERQVQIILDAAFKIQSRDRCGNPWTYAGIGLLLWIFGAVIRVSGYAPPMGPLTLVSDIAGLVFIVMSIRSNLRSK